MSLISSHTIDASHSFIEMVFDHTKPQGFSNSNGHKLDFHRKMLDALCVQKKRPFSVKNRLLSIRYEERKKSLDAITRLDVSVAFFLSRFFFSLKKNLLLGSKAVWFRSHHLWIVNATVCLCFFLFNLFSQLDVELGRMTSRYFVGAKNANTVPSFYYRVHKIHDQCSIQWEWKESHAEKRIGKN